MRRWALALLLLACTGAIVNIPRLGAGSIDLPQLRAAMLALAPGLEESRFPSDSMLPEDYVYVASKGEGPLLSAYVAYYPEQRMGAKAPHKPSLCYATQGWTTGPVEKWNVSMGGVETVVQTLAVEYRGHRRWVVYWEHQLGRIPVARHSSGWAYEPVERLLAGRTDLAWVRLELLPRGDADPWETLAPIVENLGLAVARAMRAPLD